MSANLPTYSIKKNSNGKRYAYTYIDGNRIGLGPDNEQAKQRYNALIAEWLSNNKQLPSVKEKVISISEVCTRFLAFASEYYCGSSEYYNFTTVVKILKNLYGSIDANAFGPQKLEAVRQIMIQKKWQRKSINKQIIRIKNIFKWAESKEIISKGMYQHLSTLAPLKRGRCPGVPEGKKVMPVPEDNINAIQRYISRQVWAMIQLQLYTGARPGEITDIRAFDIDKSRNVWVYRPAHHKNTYRDQEREIYIGNNAKEILAEFIIGKLNSEYLFSPKDANRELKQRNAEGKRRANQKPAIRKTGRVIGNKYTVDSYRRAIHRACEKAGVTKWSPHQLRHNAGTVVREKYGIEAAQLILGHARADVTQIYAERNKAMAYDIAAKIG